MPNSKTITASQTVLQPLAKELSTENKNPIGDISCTNHDSNLLDLMFLCPPILLGVVFNLVVLPTPLLIPTILTARFYGSYQEAHILVFLSTNIYITNLKTQNSLVINSQNSPRKKKHASLIFFNDRFMIFDLNKRLQS